MNEDTSVRLWKLAHGELSPTERQALEQELDRNPALREEARRIGELDQSLRFLLPLAAETDLALEDRILTEIPTTDAGTAAPNRGGAVHVPSPKARHALTLAWRSSLGVAACLLIMAGIFVFGRVPPIEWQDSEITPPTLRGVEGPRRSAYKPGELKGFAQDLEGLLTDAYCAGSSRNRLLPTFGHDWELRARFQELANGKLMVQITARSSKDKAPPREFTQYFLSAQDFTAGYRNFARQVADELGADPAIP